MSDFEPREEKQTRGPTLHFEGRLLAEATTERPGKRDWQEVEIWETRGGNWICIMVGVKGDRSHDFIKATVVEREKVAGSWAHQCAVMDALEWSSLARAAVKKAFGWTLVQEVE